MPDTANVPASDVLGKICADTRAAVAEAKTKISLEALRLQITVRGDAPRGFGSALKQAVAEGRYGLIAEIKKASPSGGLIRPDFDPPALAHAYVDGGAACLSVLTNAPHFQGSPAHLRAARDAVRPAGTAQGLHSRAMAGVRKPRHGGRLHPADPCGVDRHPGAGTGGARPCARHGCAGRGARGTELDRALGLETQLIGVNNRNLKTLVTDLAVTEQLAPLVPADQFLIAESGIRSNADLQRLSSVGTQCFLVGESLLRQQDVSAATRALLTGP